MKRAVVVTILAVIDNTTGVTVSKPGKDRALSEGNSRTALVVGAVAGAIGIALASWLIVKQKLEQDATRSCSEHDKHVADVLSDCRARIDEIHSHLAEQAPAK